MWGIASVLNAIYGVLLAPFRWLHPLAGLVVISALTGIVMLLIFGRSSNQRAIRSTKGRLKAHIAEIWLFRDDLAQMLLAIVRVLANTGRYFAHSLRPLVFIFVPVLIILVLTGVRYEHRPFLVGERAIYAVKVSDASWASGDQLQLTGSEGVAVTSGALRIPARNEINWEIEARAPGAQTVTLATPRGEVTKRVRVVADEGALRTALSPIAPGRGPAFSARFLEFPGEPPLPASSGLAWIDVVGWPHRELTLFGLGVHWLVVFFVVSLVAGFAVKDLFGVEV